MNKRQQALLEWFTAVDAMKPIMRPCMEGYWCGMPGGMGMGGSDMREAYRNWKSSAKTGEWRNGVDDWKYEERMLHG